MVKSEHLNTEQYSKILDRMVKIKDGPSDDYYKLIGLESVLENALLVKPLKEIPVVHKNKRSRRNDSNS